MNDEDEYTGTDMSDMVQEYVYKIVVVGNYSVGKTTLIKRLLAAHLPPGSAQGPVEDIHVSPTVGTDFFSHVVENVTPGQNVRLQIWDTAGLQRYATVHESTYRNASLVLCVFDVTDMRSLEDLMERHLTTASDYIPNLDQQNLIFIGNKLDLLASGAGPDEAARQRALAANARRAASPEAAFTAVESSHGAASSGADEGNDEQEPVDLEAIVTAADLQAQVFSILPDANYVEVSARTAQGVDDALDRICQAALFNDHALPANCDPLAESREAFTQSCLPRNRVLLRAAGLFREAGRVPPTHAHTTVPATTRPTANADSTPLPTPSEKEHTAVPEDRLRKPAGAVTGSPSQGSWRQAGAFSFDMAPPNHFNDTMNFNSDVFSPAERDGDNDDDDDVRVPAPSANTPPPRSTPLPPAAAATPTATSALTPEQKRLLRTPISQLTPQQREARRALEHEEMKGLLGKSAGRNQAAGDGIGATSSEGPSMAGSTATQKPTRTFKDLDDDAHNAGGRDADGGGRKPFRSILDDEEERLAAERAGNEPGESDDDAVAFQDRLRARMDDIDKDASLKKIELKRAKDREKNDKKKKKKGDKAVKADGKCGACQCS